MPRLTSKTPDSIRKRMGHLHGLSELLQHGQFRGEAAPLIVSCMDEIQKEFDRLQARLARALEAQPPAPIAAPAEGSAP